MKNVLSTIVTVVIVLIAAFYLYSPARETTTERPLGLMSSNDAYLATTTPQVADLANLCVRPAGQTQSQTGVLGTVNILNANTSAFTIYDATTSSSLLRTGQAASSTLILAEFPASPTEGMYIFNVQTRYGILVDYATAATVSTSTITFLCQL